MMGDLGTWTDFGPWSKCPECKPYGQTGEVIIKRTRKCQVDGICKDNCPNAMGSEEIKVCDKLKYCEADYKNNTHCMKTKPDDDKVCIFNFQKC